MKLVLFINLLIATWMYNDAKNRLQYLDKKTKFYTKPWEAFVGGLFLGVIGLIIWFFIRPKKSEIREQATKNMTINIKKKEGLSLVNKILIAFSILFLILFIGGFIVGFLSTWATTYVVKSELSSTTTTIILSNTEIVKNIVKEYHKTHTYSKEDFFVCGDMAIDVWNLIKTKGINAKIIIGNIDNPDTNFTEYNHAWVLAEVEPFTWLALETTGGYIVYNETNPNYYKGYFFDNPSEFKKYLDLKKNTMHKLTELMNLKMNIIYVLMNMKNYGWHIMRIMQENKCQMRDWKHVTK
ncbi:MAG: transglutaminase domain-containing protein [Candidatus Aenigmarchaeota archaeon]|nr:transglutaminase domain-containing protein [Candidatus Aenigmarchaeota archaeon]